MITKEEIDKLKKLGWDISNNMIAQKEDVNFLLKLKRETSEIEQECVAVLQMIRRR